MMRFEIPGGIHRLVALPEGWIPCVPPPGVSFLATEPTWALPPVFSITVEDWIDAVDFDAEEFVASMPGGQLLLFETEPDGGWHLVAAHLIGERPAMAEQRSLRCEGWRVTLTLTVAADQFAASTEAAQTLLQCPLPLAPLALDGQP
jgi:hypothetical protein